MIREIIPNQIGGPSIPSIDHLYLDMNGIIHTFKDPNLQTKLLDRLDCEYNIDSEDTSSRMMEKFIFSIMLYIEEIVYRFPPRKTLLFALDGVAPAAKLNQQRERRWLSFKNSTGLPKRHTNLPIKPQSDDEKDLFNSVSITAGTNFMKQLSQHIDFFIKRKLQDDSVWRGIENIIFSDSSVPGEGEHKIIDHIRDYQNSNNYEKNDKHCIYGMDSDLVMLSLVTHEENMYILRDWMESIQNISFNWKIKRKVYKKKTKRGIDKYRFDHKFHLVDISVVRKFIESYMKEDKGNERNIVFETNRVIDDFMLMLFLCGNDFITSLPNLDIGKEENALGYLFKVYRTLFNTAFQGNYITDTSNVNNLINLELLEIFLKVIGRLEPRVFTNRLKRELQIINEKKRQEKPPTVDTNTSNKELSESTTTSTPGHHDDRDLEIVKSTLNPEHFKNVLSMVELKKVECFNCSQDIERFMMLSSVLSSISGKFDSSYVLHSDLDSEIMIKIPFKQPLALCSLKLGIKGDQGLKGIVMKLFANQNVDFVTMHEVKPTQDFSSDLVFALENNDGELQLKMNAFQNVSQLTIVVENVLHREESITLEQLVLFGNVSSQTGTKLTKLKKQYYGKKNTKKDYNQKKHKSSFQLNQEEQRVSKFKILTSAISLKKKHDLPPPCIDMEKLKINYYKKKEHISYDTDAEGGGLEVQKLVSDYIHGLYFIFIYYYFGVPSWEWEYKHHYAPMASDICNLTKILPDTGITFSRGIPLTPIEGLLAVLPPSRMDMLLECGLEQGEKESIRDAIENPESPLSFMFFSEVEINSSTNWVSLEESVDIDPNDEGLKTSLKDPFYHYARMVVHLPFVNIEKIRDTVGKSCTQNHTFGNVRWYKWDETCSKTQIPSTLSILPSIDNSHVVCECVPFRNDPFHDVSVLKKQKMLD